MNIYVITEGNEKDVFKHWIPQINSNLTFVENLSEIESNNFIIYSGGGYPNYYEMIDKGIEDVNENELIDRFVICVDSEELSYDERYYEIEEYIGSKDCRVDIRIVVQHFCIEAWALGNKKIFPRSISDEVLSDYVALFNVVTNDPEQLPAHNERGWNRAQFAYRYLKKISHMKSSRLAYSKRKTDFIHHRTYVEQLVSRLNETGHIPSYSFFIYAFLNDST